MSKSSPSKNSAGVKKLRAIQRAFATGVSNPLTADQEMQPKWADGTSARKKAATFIKPNDRLTSFERLEIYNKQYWFRLIDSFYEDFPGLRALIGDERFYDLTIAYITKYRSASYTMRDLGMHLEKFVTKEPQRVAPHETLAREIVRLEWAHINAFDSAELPPLEIDALLDGGSDPAKLRLDFQPHITFLACTYAVDDFILAVRRREEPRGEASNAINEKTKRKAVKKIAMPKPKKIWLAVHRSNTFVYYKRLEFEAYLICTALQKGLPLQKACELAFSHKDADPTFSAKLQKWFALWASFGWFCDRE